MGGQRNISGKRRSDYSDGGGGKRRNSGDDRHRERDGSGYAPDPDDTVFRYLCPGKRIGSILGRGGEIAKQLRSDTSAKMRIGETVPGCDERIITIWSSRKETNNSDETGDLVCAAQDALFKVHGKIVVDDMAVDEEQEGEAGGGQVTARLLVPSDQIGCVIGKGGSIVQTIRSDTGAQIRIMKDEHTPTCALPSDELIQVNCVSFFLSALVLILNPKVVHFLLMT
jgi:poly(rC)-binding protein 3/4